MGNSGHDLFLLLGWGKASPTPGSRLKIRHGRVSVPWQGKGYFQTGHWVRPVRGQAGESSDGERNYGSLCFPAPAPELPPRAPNLYNSRTSTAVL